MCYFDTVGVSALSWLPPAEALGEKHVPAHVDGSPVSGFTSICIVFVNEPD